MMAFFLAAILLATQSLAWGEELTVRLNYLGPEKPSPFNGQLYVKISNEGFTSVPLLQKIISSSLLVDGHPFKRTDTAFLGPEGLPVKGSWEGCMALEDYVPDGLTPGSHHIQLQLGTISSEDNHVHAMKKTAAAGSPKEALKQVETLKNVIPEALLPQLRRELAHRTRWRAFEHRRHALLHRSGREGSRLL